MKINYSSIRNEMTEVAYKLVRGQITVTGSEKQMEWIESILFKAIKYQIHNAINYNADINFELTETGQKIIEKINTLTANQIIEHRNEMNFPAEKMYKIELA